MTVKVNCPNVTAPGSFIYHIHVAGTPTFTLRLYLRCLRGVNSFIRQLPSRTAVHHRPLGIEQRGRNKNRRGSSGDVLRAFLICVMGERCTADKRNTVSQTATHISTVFSFLFFPLVFFFYFSLICVTSKERKQRRTDKALKPFVLVPFLCFFSFL